jgi:hypothetical protein
LCYFPILITLTRAEGKQLCCRPGTAVKLLWPAVNPALARKLGDLGPKQASSAYPKPAVAESRPVPQKASQQHCGTRPHKKRTPRQRKTTSAQRRSAFSGRSSRLSTPHRSRTEFHSPVIARRVAATGRPCAVTVFRAACRKASGACVGSASCLR